MSDLRKGKVDLILVTDISRPSRNISDFSEILKTLQDHDSSFLSMKEQFDTSTPAGKMMLYNMINLAQFEREQTAERVALGCHARAMRGLLNGGHEVLGFDLRLWVSSPKRRRTVALKSLIEDSGPTRPLAIFSRTRPISACSRSIDGIKTQTRGT